ncbi:hypothetical protein B0H19DRAFT_1060220 [Mycena capillaripes]|nr:hypothetical protein B0H19DRAFT_1060220 [Mycena capillaripes]
MSVVQLVLRFRAPPIGAQFLGAASASAPGVQPNHQEQLETLPPQGSDSDDEPQDIFGLSSAPIAAPRQPELTSPLLSSPSQYYKITTSLKNGGVRGSAEIGKARKEQERYRWAVAKEGGKESRGNRLHNEFKGFTRKGEQDARGEDQA